MFASTGPSKLINYEVWSAPTLPIILETFIIIGENIMSNSGNCYRIVIVWTGTVCGEQSVALENKILCTVT